MNSEPHSPYVVQFANVFSISVSLFIAMTRCFHLNCFFLKLIGPFMFFHVNNCCAFPTPKLNSICLCHFILFAHALINVFVLLYLSTYFRGPKEDWSNQLGYRL